MVSQLRAPLPIWRPATAEDAGALRELERAANLVGLAHVFPADGIGVSGRGGAGEVRRGAG